MSEESPSRQVLVTIVIVFAIVLAASAFLLVFQEATTRLDRPASEPDTAEDPTAVESENTTAEIRFHGGDPLVLTRLENKSDGLFTIWPTVAPHDGDLYIYAYNGPPDNGTVWTGHLLDNTTGRTVWEDHWISFVHIVDGQRRSVATGNVTETGIEWTNRTLEPVPRSQATAEARNLSVEFYNSSSSPAEFNADVSGVPEGGRVLLDYWWPVEGDVPAMQQHIEQAGNQHATYDILYARLYYERGDQRVLLGVFDPADVSDFESDWELIEPVGHSDPSEFDSDTGGYDDE